MDKIFCHFIQNGSLSAELVEAESDAEKKVQEWLQERYAEYQDRLQLMLEAKQISVQEQALISMMHLIQAQGQKTAENVSDSKENQFPLQLLEVDNNECELHTEIN